MRALVTGGTGLLGNNVLRTLVDAGHEVWALATSKEKARRVLGDTAVQVDPGDHSNAIELTNGRGTMELAQAAHAMGGSKDDLHQFSQHHRIAA